MTRAELELQVEQLEDLIVEIGGLVDDAGIADGELRDQLRALLEEDDDDE